MNNTTIQVDTKIKKRLDNVKSYSKETYNEVIEKLLDISEIDSELSDQTISNIEKSLNEIKQGKTYTLSEAKVKLGI
jgi:predicted transcriptional regulator